LIFCYLPSWQSIKYRDISPTEQDTTTSQPTEKILTNMPTLLELQDVSFSFRGSGTVLLEHINLAVSNGDYLVIRGASGAGKSTLLKLLCRLHEPMTGNILFHGRLLTAIAPAQLRSSISYVAQIPSMVEGSISENLLMPFTFQANRLKPKPSGDMIRDMLDRFCLNGLSPDHSAMQLSVGQKQRLALMRSLLLNPEILLLDEPTSALDRESTEMVLSIVERLNTEEGKTILTVTHNLQMPDDSHRVRNFKLENHTLSAA
jgi:putative ABC transport system ATP-binding protein